MLPEHLKLYSTPTPVLDKGFVRLVDAMGDDQAIVDMARISYEELSTQKISTNEGLIRYLMRMKHTSPFEGVEVKLHIKMPIFVARQWFRHRTASANEMSARYSVLPEDFYVPEYERVRDQSIKNKQGSGIQCGPEVQECFVEGTERTGEMAFAEYHGFLEMEVARELARINLPLSTYTEFYWKQNLHNLLHLLHLRADSHAQWEIQQYANTISHIVEAICPLAWKAFVDYRRDAVTFSRMELGILGDLAAEHHAKLIERVNEGLNSGDLSKREAREFLARFGLVL